MPCRFGRLYGVDEVETDIEIGWANRLPQLYRAARSLAFDERRSGRCSVVTASPTLVSMPSRRLSAGSNWAALAGAFVGGGLPR